MYHFEGRVARREGYYISRDVSRYMMDTIIEGCVAHRNGCMDKYVPHGSRTERHQVTSPDLRDTFYSLHFHGFLWRLVRLVHVTTRFRGLS
uniref:Uncharacterized protein n=1 Tax=Solanum tuberosum TaxID=4113 RepID=M1E0N0_SOLTU